MCVQGVDNVTAESIRCVNEAQSDDGWDATKVPDPTLLTQLIV